MMRPVILTLAALVVAAPGAGAADPAMVLLGRGVQVYACAQAGGDFAWRLTGPDAVLLDAAGNQAGRHFAGPTWQAQDGSAVVGEVVTASPAPAAGAVPWLVLRAKSHDGAGVFASVTYVARTRTVGGAAPADGCDAAHAGAEAKIAYSAAYTFFRQAQ